MNLKHWLTRPTHKKNPKQLKKKIRQEIERLEEEIRQIRLRMDYANYQSKPENFSDGPPKFEHEDRT